MSTLRSLLALRCLILFTAEGAKDAKINSKHSFLNYNMGGLILNVTDSRMEFGSIHDGRMRAPIAALVVLALVDRWGH